MVNKNFTKKNLINKVYQSLGFSKNVSASLINDFFDTITSELVKKNRIKITSFGTLEVVEKKQRMGRNPKTKVETIISARKIVKFKPSDLIKSKLNNQ